MLPCISLHDILFTYSYCEEGLQEAVCTLIWAAPRLSADIKELDEVSVSECTRVLLQSLKIIW